MLADFLWLAKVGVGKSLNYEFRLPQRYHGEPFKAGLLNFYTLMFLPVAD